MNRRDAVKTLGALFASIAIPKVETKTTKRQDGYVLFLDNIQSKLNANLPVDCQAVMHILESIDPGVAYYYCREFYFNDKMRPYITNSDKLLNSIAEFKSSKIKKTTKLFG